MWTMQDIEESTMDRVVELAKDGLRANEIAQELEVNKSTVSRALAKAKSLGNNKFRIKPAKILPIIRTKTIRNADEPDLC